MSERTNVILSALLPLVFAASAVHAGDCPGTGDCCTANGTPGCSDPGCCLAVCSVDEFCCGTEWDSICVETAVEECGINCGDPCTESGNNCCRPAESPGCQNPECCGIVCDFDPFCCAGVWDEICAGEAAVLCNDACPICVAADTNASLKVDVDDLINVILDWGSDGLDRNTDVDLDGVVGMSDLMAVIERWGDCEV